MVADVVGGNKVVAADRPDRESEAAITDSAEFGGAVELAARKANVAGPLTDQGSLIGWRP
jgi:hypothetical protein